MMTRLASSTTSTSALPTSQGDSQLVGPQSQGETHNLADGLEIARSIGPTKARVKAR